MRFQPNFRLAAAALAASALAIATPVLAQTTDSSATIQLHMPGQGTNTGGLHLHMPAKHRAPKHKPASKPEAAAPAVQEEPMTYGSIAPQGLPTPAAPPQRTAAKTPAQHTAARAKAAAPVAASSSRTLSRAERRKAVQEVLAAPANSGATSTSGVDAGSGAIPFTFDAEAPPPPPAAKSTQPPQKARASSVVKPRPQLASPEPAPRQTAAPAAPKHSDPHAGLTKEGEVVFPANSTDLSSNGSDHLKSLAGNLNSALDSGAARVQIEAYGGTPGDKSSDSRRLSLRRALAVRQLLIDSGIPTDRIDVRALGGAEDRGNADRVDVFLRGAT